MTTTDPHIAAWRDQMDQLVAKNIRTRPDEASVPVFQLTWDDGYSLPAWVQPRPGTFTA